MAPKKKPKPYEMSVVGSFMSPTELEQEEAAKWVLLSDIDLPSKQPRRYFEPEKMAQLVASVRQKGVLEPLLVRPKSDGHVELVAGERRLRAAKEVGLEKVRCVVQELSDNEAFEIALLENLQRDDLNPVEETQGILELLETKLGQPRDTVVKHFNLAAYPEQSNTPEWGVIKSLFETIGRFTPNSFRTNRLPLLKLPEEIFTAIAEGKIAYSKARLIARVDDKKAREELLTDTISQNLSQRDLQQKIRELKTPKERRLSKTDKVIIHFEQSCKQAKKNQKTLDKDKFEQIERLLKEIDALIKNS